MVFETTITTINPSNAPHSHLFARMESAKQKIFTKYNTKPENSIITGYLIDKHHNVIAYTFQGTTNETNKFLRDYPSTRIYSFSNLSVKQVTNYNWTSSLLSKELNLNRAKILPLPPHELNNYDIPMRRPATETVEQIIHRLESKNLTITLADITALIVSTNNSKIVKKNETSDYNIKEILLSDGHSIFNFTLWGTDATGPLGRNISTGDAITLLHAKVTLLESTDNQKVNFTIAKDTGEIFPDSISTRAKQLLQNKNTILTAYQNNSLPTLTKTYIPKAPTDFTIIPCEVINTQQLAIYLKQNENTEELTQLPPLQTETQTEIKTPDRIYEIRNVTLTGLGNVNAESITYDACSICKKKTEKCNAKCSPNAEVILHAFCPNIEITDWSGTASNLLAGGEELMTLLDTKSPILTQRIAQRNPSSLLFQTQTSIRVKVYENSYGDKIRTSGKIVTAEKRNFTQNLGKIYSTLSNNIERTNNIAYALLEDVTYQNGQLTIAKQPTNYVVLYAIGCQDPEITTENQTHKITNTVDIISTLDASFTRLQAECICDTNDLIRNKITENDHALLTVDHIDFYSETKEKTPLANITAVYIIANKENDYTASATLKQFITEAKHMKDALTRKPTQDPSSSPTTSSFLANIQTPLKKQKTSSSESSSTY